MTTASKTETLHSAMAAAFAKIEGATKSVTGQVGQQKYKYADIGSVIAAIKPALIEHGLFFTQHPQPSEGGVKLETILHHTGGESMGLGTLFVPANKNDAQGFGSALTYARRYALVTAFGVPVEDDDGNAAVKGQRESTVSPSPPHQQEPRRQTGVKLNGPHKSITALESAIRDFVTQMDACKDWSSWTAYRDSKEVQSLIEQAQEDHPDWWNGWEGMPDGFTPLGRRIEIKEYNLANQVADYAKV